MEGWAAQELQYAQLGDARRNKRLVRVVEDLAAQPNESVPQACGNWAATKATYEFWKSPRIKPNDIRMAHQKSTVSLSIPASRASDQLALKQRLWG
jgi:hypothetical protein